MTTRRILEIAAFCVALLVAALAVHAWLASRDDQRRLAATLSTQKQIIDAATADQQTSALQLKDTLAQIDKLKSATQTPEQILRELPRYLPLPEPITMASATSTASGATAGAAANQQQGIATSQFPTASAPSASQSPGAGSESSKSSNNKPTGLPSASVAPGTVDRASNSRLKAFLGFFRDIGKARPARSSAPSSVCQPETTASIASPVVNVSPPDPADSNSSHKRIPDPAAAPAGNFSAGKTNPAAPPSVSESANDASPKSSDSNSDIKHVHDFNGPARNLAAMQTSQGAVPCVSQSISEEKAPQSTLGVGAPGPKPPADTPPPQLAPERDAKAPQSTLGVETPGPGLPAQALAAHVAPELDASAEIPAADLKPLFDFVQDCRSCDAQLKAANQTQADNATKILALTKERDAAITVGKGGTFLLRLRRNALWFAAGAAVTSAAYAARH